MVSHKKEKSMLGVTFYTNKSRLYLKHNRLNLGVRCTNVQLSTGHHNMLFMLVLFFKCRLETSGWFDWPYLPQLHPQPGISFPSDTGYYNWGDDILCQLCLTAHIEQDKTNIYFCICPPAEQFWMCPEFCCSVHGSMNNSFEKFIIGCFGAQAMHRLRTASKKNNTSVSLVKYVNKRLKLWSISFIIM